jgi:hypothetical protein
MTDQLDAIQPATAATGDNVDAATTSEYRYPGSPPFADTEVGRLLFHGRTMEIDYVLHSILSVDLFLVYAVSGVGKTSLLTAGVLEPLRERGLFPVVLRLNDPTHSLLELIDAEIREAGDKAEGITVMRRPWTQGAESAPSTLWDLLSTLEVWRGNSLQRLVLIFDQFEELFTLEWGDEQRGRFIEEFGQVVRGHRTQPIGSDAAVALPPPNVKFTILIREEFLGELESLAVHVPTIMQHRFRLDGLLPDQAKAAICAPAAIVDPRLATRRFTYTEGAAQAILDFLGTREERGRPVPTKSIDPCQLQIICQHIERAILPGKPAAPDPEAVAEIAEEDLGGRAGLERILRDFYRRELMSFPSRQRKLVRHLCESGLINQNGRRLSLEEGEIADKFDLPTAMLDELVSRRLLRAEPRVGSVYYELAHDSLAAPILAYRDAVRATRRRRLRLWIGVLLVLAGIVAIVALVASRNSTSPETVTAPGAVAAVPIAVGGSAIGTINEDVFEFEAVEGQQLVVEAAPQDAVDLWLDVSDPNGFFEQASQPTTGQPVQIVLVAPIPGKYQVTVGGPSSGSFELSVEPIDVPVVVLGEQTAGSITDTNMAQTFVFEQSGTQPFVIDVTPDPALDVVLEVTDPDGLKQWRDEGGKGDAEVAAQNGSVAGRYRVVVSGPSRGRFQLTARTTNSADVAVGDATQGTVDPANPYSVFDLELSADQAVVVRVEPSPELDTVLEVTDPAGVVRYEDQQLEGDTESLVVAGGGGRYRIAVSGFGSSTGHFVLSVLPIDVADIAVGDVVPGSIDESGESTAFHLQVPPGELVAVELRSEESLDGTLEATDDTGFTDLADDKADGGVEAVVVGSTAGGPTSIVVGGFEDTTGRFELSVRSITPIEMAVGDTVSGTIGDDEPVAVYAFEAQETGPLVVEVDPERSFNPIFKLTHPDGLTETISWVETGETETLPIDGAGRYRVVVTGRATTTEDHESTRGDFKISVHTDD